MMQYHQDLEKSRVLRKRIDKKLIENTLIVEEERADIVLSLFKKPFDKKVLDVGCGLGVCIKKLRELGCDVIGVDINDKGKELFGLNIIELNLNNGILPFNDKEFDTVICTDVIEHLFYPHKILREIKRVLKDDGTVIISYPNEFNIKCRVKILLGKDIGLSYFPHLSMGFISN